MTAELDPELARLAREDRADETAVGPAAAARRAAVLALQAAARLRSPRDQHVAAAILVRSGLASDVEAAQALAHAAMGSERGAQAVAAAAFDRLRMLAGKPQKFGTQTIGEPGAVRLWPVDAGTTDSERAKWDVPPLVELERRCRDAGPR